MKIRTKISSMGLLLVLLTAVSIVGIAFHQKEVLKKNINTEVDLLIQSETNKVARDVYLLCRTMQESLEQRLEHGLKVAESVLARAGEVTFSEEKAAWPAIDQNAGQPSEIALPKMLIGGKWFGQTNDFADPVPLVDEISTLLGMTCTLFQRVNDAGDMIRVATSVPDADGSRAIGTWIPRNNPDGTSNPVIEDLLSGKIFTGRSYVVKSWYLTGYLPVWDAAGDRVVGALLVGLEQESVASLRRGIMDIRVGKTGYVAVLGGKGNQLGRYIISKRGRRDEENLLRSPAASSSSVIGEIIGKALALQPSHDDAVIPVAFHRYPWQNPGEEGTRFKLAAVTYFEPWDWIIVASAYEDDFQEAQQRMASALEHMINWVTWVALAIIVLALFVSFYIARGISRPLEKAIEVFGRIGRGDLDLQLNLAARDEIGQLSKAFDTMIGNLKQVTASRDELDREVIRRSRIEQELRETSARREELELIVNHSPTVVFLWRAEPGWPVEYVSENIRQFGFSSEDFYSGALFFISIVHPDDLSRVCTEMARHKDSEKGGDLNLEYRLVDAAGEVAWVETRAWSRCDDSGRISHYQGVMLDVTARKEAENAVHQLAYYDILTGLPNRTLLLDRLDRALAQAERDERHVALFFLDLDKFKEINDSFGHAFGDLLLKAVGQRLNSVIRKNDTMARFGGDEFIILLPAVTQVGEIKLVAEKVVAAMSQPFFLEGERVKISTSVGIAMSPLNGKDSGTLLKRADMAMYIAKDQGRNGYCFFDGSI